MVGDIVSCEECKYFDEHPFVREGDFRNFCKLTNEQVYAEDICEDFDECDD